MVGRKLSAWALTVFALAVIILPTACGDGDAGLSQAEDEEMVRAETAESPSPPQAEPGVSIPPRSAPAEYTQFVVDNAISRYETQGRDTTLSHYNREESIDGQWYVFIIDENDLVIAHPDPGRLGLD